MKKIMIYAYTNFNLGDDLFIKILCERYTNTNFVIFAPREYKKLFKEINNLTVFPSDAFIIRGINYFFKKFNINDFCRRFIAKSCDAAVNIGGSIFMQGDSWESSLKDKRRMKIPNKPFFVLGANFGPYTDKEYYLKYKELFKEFTDICFRDKYSYDLFNELKNVRYADDIIFQLNKQNITHQQDKSVVISVIKPSIREHLAHYDDIYYKKIKDIIYHFVNQGYSVTLISFCENEGDTEAIEEIMKLIPDNYRYNIDKHLYDGNIKETLNVLGSCNFVVATRFHSMILGWLYNKPVFPIVYSDKMTNVIKDLNFKGYYTDIYSIERLDSEEVFASLTLNKIDITKQVKSAEEHFEQLDKLLLDNA